MSLRFLPLAVLAVMLLGALPRGQPQLRVAGSTVLMPLAEQVSLGHRETAFGFYASGTYAGAAWLARGLVDVALADIPLHVPGARGVRLGAMAVPVLVHCGVGVSDVTPSRLSALLAGSVTTWRALGGARLPVRVFFRTAPSGLAAALRAELLGRGSLGARVVRLASNGEVVREVEAVPGAVGFADPGQGVGPGVCLLAVAGRLPGAPGYPLRIEAWAYYRRGGAAVARFLEELRRRLE